MSQVQAQTRPSVANGVGRRRTDKDGGSRPDAGFRSDNQNWRQPARTSSISSSQGVHYNHLTTNNSGGLKSSTEVAVVRGASPGGERTEQEQRLLFIHTCLIGQLVEVQTKNGLVYSGIFHAINNDNKEFGVVLKMARLIRDGAVKGGKSEAVKDAQRKPPSKSVLIHGKDFVQIIAKDVLLSGDTLPNGRARENRAEIVTDAVLSQVPHRELERELMPWKPDDDASENLSLNFSHTWRSWDQFETNKALFGVESTFNEELYTTKLERGPQMREREREALRIAREIEGQTTRNIHLAEERGMRLTSEVEAMDEESRYSSVLRAEKDVGEDDEDGHIDDHNDETFGGVSFAPLTASTSDSNTSTPAADNKSSRPSSADSSQTVNGPSKRESLQDRRASSVEKGDVGTLDSLLDTHREHLRLRHLLVGDKSKRSNKGPGSPYHSPVGRGSPLMSPLVGDPAAIQALNLDPSCPNVPEDVYREFHEFKLQETAKKGKKQREDQVNELKSFSESLKKKDLEQPRSPRSPLKSMSGEFVREGSARPAVTQDVKSSLAPPAPMLSTAVSAPSPSSVPLPTGLGAPVKQLSGSSDSSGPPSASGPLVAPSSVPPPISFSAQLPSSAVVPPGQLVSSPTLSRSSSSASVASNGGAAASKKSTLNPNAKEFKLNPNAKAFTPSFSSPRPASPMMQSPIYMHASLPPATSLQGVPLQYMQQQPVQSAQFTPYHNAMAAAAAAAASGAGPYMQQPGGFVSGFPGGGMPQVLPGQPSMKIPAHSQQQVVSPFGQQQPIRYPSQAPPMQPAFLHPNGQLYPPTQMMLAHPGQLMYIQHYPQGMIQGQPVPPPPPQGPLPPPQPSQQNQQQKHRSAGIGMHFSGAPGSFLPGQQHQHQQSQMHFHNTLPGGLAPGSMNSGAQPPQGGIPNSTGPTGQNGGSSGGVRAGGKGAAGGFQQQ
ncbi:hypothetical protein CY35_06G041800 [Sphagnum magellanicum]|nr:hypothetical protein CY35_06G041800 [Sphagnum magellanicum]KAH9559100.1 hypothetical protein CY35_06G041800 [Sphagnum magellanicum]KAH9559101.1 hypothetical protein CY35_06G041800 [Sphagnum magellanicum]KAH9559102.1 hypothetical protein CY35_06G041800 [Sphagnum magellanicum]